MRVLSAYTANDIRLMFDLNATICALVLQYSVATSSIFMHLCVCVCAAEAYYSCTNRFQYFIFDKTIYVGLMLVVS